MLPYCKPDDDANRGGERHRDEETDEAEQIAERRDGEHYPDGIELDARRDEIGDST
jgi:hypothetical protein